MSDVQPLRIKPGGTVMGVALSGPDQVHLLVRLDQGAGRLLCFDLAGRVHWRVDLPGPGKHWRRCITRIADCGSAWLGEERTLTRLGADGQIKAAIDVQVEPGEELGSFLVLRDGFVVALYRPSPGKENKPRGRVARLDGAGDVVWSTVLPRKSVAYAGVVEMGVDSGWQLRTKKPWKPEDWQPAWRGEPLLLSADRLLARYFELRSGLGRTFCLNWTDGRIIWTTEPRPEDSVALAGSADFMLGVQGYGAFDMYLYDCNGGQRQHWASHAEVVTTELGEMRGVEMENCLPSRMHFCVFNRDGSIRKGPHLDGYYTTYPVVNRQGVVAFWRHGRLRTVDASLQENTLWEERALAETAVMTRMLLADDGTLVFGLEDELFLFPTHLGPMARGVWPCGGGNPRGNPTFP